MIKLELPMEPLALKHAGEMLSSLAVALGAQAGPVVHSGDDFSAALALAAAGPVITGDGSGTALPPAATDTTEPPPPPAATDTTEPPPPPAGVVLDAEGEGIPWDVRIHGSGKTFLKSGARKGLWKYARNVDEATIAAVEAELKAAQAIAPPAATDTTDPPPPPPAGTDTTDPPPPPPGAAPVDFPALVVKVTGLINEGRTTAEAVTAEAVALGLPSYPLLATRPDLIPQFNERLDVICPPTP